MTKLEYAEEVAKKVVGGIGAKEVVKNGVTFTAVEVRVDDNEQMTACHYIDREYDDEVDIDEVVDRINRAVENGKEEQELAMQFAEDLKDYEKVKDDLMLRMYNSKAKDGYPLARSTEEFGFDDLIIVPAVARGEKSAVVSPQMMELWGVTQDELFEKCFENIRDDVEIKSMVEVLTELMCGRGLDEEDVADMLGDEPDNGMYVISNKNKIYGSVAVLFAKDKLQELFPNGYVILPSSIHEVIAVALPDEVAQFDAMVNEVNDTQVAPDEVLGNKAYVFK